MSRNENTARKLHIEPAAPLQPPSGRKEFKQARVAKHAVPEAVPEEKVVIGELKAAEQRAALKKKATEAFARTKEKEEEEKSATKAEEIRRKLRTGNVVGKARAGLGMTQLEEEEERLKEGSIVPSEELTKEYVRTRREKAPLTNVRIDELLGGESDRLRELIEDRLEKNPHAILALSQKPKEQRMALQEHGTSGMVETYQRTMADYRDMLAKGNDQRAGELAHSLIRMNVDLGIENNALVQKLMRQEETEVGTKAGSDVERFKVVTKLKNAIDQNPEGHKMKMSVDVVKSRKLLAHPDQVWDEVAKLLPETQGDMATEYVLTLARMNQAANSLDRKMYDSANSALHAMNQALGLEGNALIQSEMKYWSDQAELKNPFE